MGSDPTPQRLVTERGFHGLELDQSQGDVLIGLQKNFDRFIFFEITDNGKFKSVLRDKIVQRARTTRTVHNRRLEFNKRKETGDQQLLPFIGLNVIFTN